MPERRVAILTFGSRGDVQPFVALALALQRRGVHPVVGAHAAHRALVEERGVQFAELAGDPVEWMRSQARLRALVRRPAVLAAARRFTVDWEPTMRRMLEQSAELVDACDAMVFSHGALAGPHLAEALAKPAAFASLQPWDVTAEYPSVALRQAPRTPGPARRRFNRASHWLGEQVVWFPWRGVVNRWRVERLGLPPVGLLATPWRRLGPEVARLYGYSPFAAPPPADWPADRFVGGWWELPRPAGWRPPGSLEAFLAAGDPPVYVGFGSHLPARDLGAVERVMDEVAARLGLRLVVAAGWAGLGGGSAGSVDRYVVTEVPHDWLFPRVKAAIHHGGAGTTGAALRAGAPQLVVPAFFDQYHWSVRVTELGVGARLVPREFGVDGLEAALRRVLEPAVAARAAAVAATVRDEPGADGAARHLLGRFGWLS